MSQAAGSSPLKGDFVLPFDIARAGVRGRLVRLDLASARALSAHALPEAASRIAGETLALGVLLGTALKLDGRLTVQTKSDGPLDLVAADYYGGEDSDSVPAGKERGVRGFARIDEARFAALKNPRFAELMGRGSLAITIEPKRGGNAYQGIVALSPDGIANSAETYFLQSEQLPTVLRLAAAPLFIAGEKQPHWQAAGIMLQMTPESARPGAAPEEMQTSDDWQRLSLILKTVEDLELLDTTLAPEKVLWRLFHEDEVRVQPALPIAFRCDCAPDRIAQVLKSYSPEEREGLADPDGMIRARCEFCGTTHEIAPGSLT
jgi:molecular chaperone Hsp33